jgi:glycosyltransferase involved in cell wall biosynthesis
MSLNSIDSTISGNPGTPRILHVTEATAGGIITVLASFTKRQIEAGAQATVFYLERPEGPAPEHLPTFFDDRVELRSFTGGRSKIKDYIRLSRALLKTFNRQEFDAIHVHSSKAGFLARILWPFSRRRSKLFYSPHGFAFLRLDTSPAMRFAFRLAELVLARVGHGLILTCDSERRLAVETLGASHALTVTTGIDQDTLDPGDVERRTTVGQSGRPTVITIARVSYQKAPWRFADVARELQHLADFVWIGAGDPNDEQRWLAGAPVTVTGWQTPEQLRTAVSSADILLFPTLWEGMPLSLIQAQAQGLPAVVSDAVGNRDAVLDGETGFVCSTDEQLVLRTRKLIEDYELRMRMARATQKWVRENHTDRDLGLQSLAIYAKG